MGGGLQIMILSSFVYHNDSIHGHNKNGHDNHNSGAEAFTVQYDPKVEIQFLLNVITCLSFIRIKYRWLDLSQHHYKRIHI